MLVVPIVVAALPFNWPPRLATVGVRRSCIASAIRSETVGFGASQMKPHQCKQRALPTLRVVCVIAITVALWVLLLRYGHGQNAAAASEHGIAVGPEYATTHVYIAHGDFDAFVNSFISTFGGRSTKRIVANVLPVPSSTEQQAVLTPEGLLSIFAYQTPIPFPFGEERTGYLVTDMDQAIKAARDAGAEVIVEPFKDPIGMDAVIQWPGGVKMQLYLHVKPSTNPPPGNGSRQSRVCVER
jgi:hypothetical protein